MTRKRDTLITPAAYAQRIGLSRQIISRQIRTGQIPTHDGLIDPIEADRAREGNVASRRLDRRAVPFPQSSSSGEFDIDGIADLLDTDSEPIDDTPAAPTAREVLDTVLSRRHLVPGILAKLGVQDPALIHCADDLFCSLVLFLGGDVAYDADLDDLPTVATDYKGIAKTHGIKFNKSIIARADKMADAAYEVIERAVNKTTQEEE